MKDIERLENASRNSQEATRCYEIDSIAAMTRDEVLSDLRQYDIKPTKELPQQLRQLLNLQPSLGQLGGVNPIPASTNNWLYAFIVARTSQLRSYVHLLAVHKGWVRFSALAAAVLFCAAAYGVYGLTQQAAHLRIEAENNRLREENERQRRLLQLLEERVDAIEDKSHKFSEMAGQQREEGTSEHGAGGPGLSLDADSIAVMEARAAKLVEHLRTYEAALEEQARVPSIWPVEGESTDSFGVRRNPFGGGSSEFHPGQDIAAPRGTLVVAPADGVVIKADWQNDYGQTVVIDHGNGLTTRYGHLSKIEVAAGQEIRRGEELGLVGNTGRCTGPGLHYEVRIGDVAVDPKWYLPKSMD